MAVVLNDVLGHVVPQYQKPMQQTFKRRVLMWDQMPLAKYTVLSNTVRWGVELQRATGHGARSEMEPIPISTAPVVQAAETSPRMVYGSMALSGLVKALIRNNAGAFIELLSQQMKHIEEGFVYHLNRMLHGDGTGTIATVNGIHTLQTDILISHPLGYSYGATQFLEDENVWVRFFSSAGADLGIARQITGINWATQTITLNAPATLPDNAIIVLGDNAGHGYNKEFRGFGHWIVNTGTIFSIACATYKRWRAQVQDDSAAPIPYDWQIVYDLIKSIDMRGDIDVGDLWVLMHPVHFRSHQVKYQGDVRYEARSFDFPKGGKKPSINVDGREVRIVEDIYMGFERMVAVRPSNIQKLLVQELEWDAEGEGQIKQFQGLDGSYGFMRMYGELAPKRLDQFGRQEGVIADSDYIQRIQQNL